MPDKDTVEVYGIVLDARCAALLDIALNGTSVDDRWKATGKLWKLGCYLALGVVGKRGNSPHLRQHAIDLLGKKR